MIKVKCIVKDFIFFLLNRTTTSIVKASFFWYLIVFVLILIIAGILRIGIPIVLSELGVPVIQNESAPEQIHQFAIGFILLIDCVIGPFLEEVAFRYPLKYGKNSLFIGFTAYVVVSTFTTQHAMDKWANMTHFSIHTFKPAFWWHVAFVTLIFILTRFERINRALSKIWDKYLLIAVYVLAAYFAYNHFPLPKVGINWLWLPILVVPQFFMALYFSYIRLRVRFLYCICLHVLLNGMVFLPSIL
jgi:hypothetical protein